MSIEEIIGRLRAVEGRGDDEDKAVAGGKLLLTEEQWQARYKEKQSGEGGSKSGSNKGEHKSQPCEQRKKNDGKEDRDT
jgi:hypothetical protein